VQFPSPSPVLTDPTKGSSRLNIFLQKRGRLSALSWQESTSGAKHAPVWKCICKIDGEPRGTGTGTHKHVARDLAANEALEYLEKQEV